MTEMKDDLLNWIQSQGLELGFTNVLDPPSILEPSQIAVGSSFSCAMFSNTREFGGFPARSFNYRR